MKNKLRLGEGIEPRCGWCRFSAETDEGSCFCIRKGVVSTGGHCRRYEYDPLKRVPSPRPSLVQHDRSEFEL